MTPGHRLPSRARQITLGAALLLALETLYRAAGLEDASQRAANDAYLADNPRGWPQRFCNTEQAFLYQAEWLNNADFQALAGGASDPHKRALAFEWLLLQTLPDGSAPAYNYPGQPPIFLPGDWAGANIDVVSSPQGPVARVTQGKREIRIPLYR